MEKCKEILTDLTDELKVLKDYRNVICKKKASLLSKIPFIKDETEKEEKKKEVEELKNNIKETKDKISLLSKKRQKKLMLKHQQENKMFCEKCQKEIFKSAFEKHLNSNTHKNICKLLEKLP